MHSPSPELDTPHEDGATPTVTLDSDEISHNMAARLTIALLGQMLYMKGQIPFPVATLGRIAEPRTDDGVSRTALRATKKRAEFLESYDDLTSHLRSTFVALSTALALNLTKYPLMSIAAPSDPTHPGSPTNMARLRQRPAKVHILLIVGSSPSAAKARILLELDGLHVERFGERHYSSRGHNGEDSTSNEDSTSAEEVECVPCIPCGRTTGPIPHTSPAGGSCAPFMPSPTPCCSSQGSLPPSPPSSESDYSPSSDEDESFSEEDSSESHTQSVQTQAVDLFARAQQAEEAALRLGERLLSRALFANGEGLGFGDEIAPTQTHILIRAPRRLAHPTWVPRQTLGSLLDRHVQRFLDGEACSDKREMRGKGGTGFGMGLRTVGVRVKCRDAEWPEDEKFLEEDVVSGDEGDEDGRNEADEDEQDDMIWWSWDSKLVGFLD